MKTKTLFICLIVFVSAAGICAAETSASFGVTCSIPVMPGINAPLIEKQEVVMQVDSDKKQVAAAEEAGTAIIPAEPQEKIEEEKITGKEEQPIVIVKTIYSR